MLEIHEPKEARRDINTDNALEVALEVAGRTLETF